jgi:hypothetical protein
MKESTNETRDEIADLFDIQVEGIFKLIDAQLKRPDSVVRLI